MKKLIKIDAEIIEEAKRELARRHFHEYRKYMNPSMIDGWWQREIDAHLQQFYVDWQNGLRPKLIIQAPPQHGKSTIINDFISWCAGKSPDARMIFSSFSERLGVRANLRLQRIMDGEKYRRTFPATKLDGMDELHSAKATRNRELLEFVGNEGYFRNTTVGGSITGEGLDLGIIDDPIKGREQANSPTIRQKVWEWFTDDFFTRFSDSGAMLMILTRWHVDDPAGRLLENDKTVKLISYPAIAVEDEAHRKAGEALFPEHKSLEFLLQRKAVMLQSSWESLYQQSPFVRGGGLFKVENLEVTTSPFAYEQVVRYWDKAGTQDGGAYTAGVKLGKTKHGKIVVIDVVRGQWSALEREQRMKQTAQLDGREVHQWIEQEPGSGGKESAEATVRNLSGFTVYVERVTGDKVTRAEPFAAQVEGGNVVLCKGEWNRDFIAEMETFPNGKYKDQVDAASGAFNKLSEKRGIDVWRF